MRHLSRTVQVANIPHYCDRCCRYVEPGEMYERIVRFEKGMGVEGKSIVRTRKVYVLKYHINPTCPYPWEDEDSLEYQLMEEAQDSPEEESSLAGVA